jgi:hypothetical protein
VIKEMIPGKISGIFEIIVDRFSQSTTAGSIILTIFPSFRG